MSHLTSPRLFSRMFIRVHSLEWLHSLVTYRLRECKHYSPSLSQHISFAVLRPPQGVIVKMAGQVKLSCCSDHKRESEKVCVWHGVKWDDFLSLAHVPVQILGLQGRFFSNACWLLLTHTEKLFLSTVIIFSIPESKYRLFWALYWSVSISPTAP